MKSRLDKYNNNDNINVPSRLAKNKNLYDELNNKIAFEEIPDFNTQTRIELTSLNQAKKSRESYQQLKDYQSLINQEHDEVPDTKEEEKVKVFDINVILEEARKNRDENDDLEKRRKLKSEEYNILSDLSKKYLTKDTNSDAPQKPKEEKDKYEGLEELINTITSKTLVGEIKSLEEKENDKDKDLLSDLVATSVELQVNVPSSYENSTENTLIDGDNDDGNTNTEEEKTIDDSFYTRSMDLSKDDFDLSDDTGEGSSAKRILLIITIIVILLAIILIVVYFILKNMGIEIIKF